MEYLVEGIMAVTWQQIVMYAVGILLIWLAIKKEYEPSLDRKSTRLNSSH